MGQGLLSARAGALCFIGGRVVVPPPQTGRVPSLPSRPSRLKVQDAAPREGRRGFSAAAGALLGAGLATGRARRQLRALVRRHSFLIANPASVGAVVEPTLCKVPLEDKPWVVYDGGSLLVAWKPAKLSMRRLRGGAPSELEVWAASGAEGSLPGLQLGALPMLGRGIAGLVVLGRQKEALSSAEAALAIGPGACAEVAIVALVQGEPKAEALAEAASVPLEPGGCLWDIQVLNASEGLRFGRLSIVRAIPLSGFCGPLPAEKEARRRLAALGHRVVGNGELCARAAGVTRTYLAVNRLGLKGIGYGDFVVEVPTPPSLQRFLDADAMKLQRKGAGSEWSGRTEHCDGLVPFDGLELRVPPGVFVPRRSALHVVEAAASVSLPPKFRLLDAGTGSGCILLALLSRFPGAFGVGIDADPAAVAAARNNAEQLNLAERAEIKLLRFESLDELCTQGCGPFHLAISNPPYLPEKIVQQVGFARELQSQSSTAFVAGEDGLEAYEELADSLARPGVLATNAWVVLGCQPGRGQKAAGPFLQSNRYKVHEEFSQAIVLVFTG